MLREAQSDVATWSAITARGLPLSSHSKELFLRGPIERQVALEDTREGEVWQLETLQDRLLNGGREEGGAEPCSDKGGAALFRLCERCYRGACADLPHPAVGARERGDEGAIGLWRHWTRNDLCFNAAAAEGDVGAHLVQILCEVVCGNAKVFCQGFGIERDPQFAWSKINVLDQVLCLVRLSRDLFVETGDVLACVLKLCGVLADAHIIATGALREMHGDRAGDCAL